MKTIVKMRFGSHLYGTATPDSDTDYKGVFLPPLRDVLCGRIRKCVTENTKSDTSKKNTVEDVDTQIYSLHYFIELACKGETVALDMLHAPNDMILETSPIWEQIRFNRWRFYTRNLQAFVGYARTQAAKYGIKGSRLSDCKRALDYLRENEQGAHILADVWAYLPAGEHISKDETQMVKLYTVCGRGIQSTCKISKGVEILAKYYENYGARAKLAETNEGIDWKAVSHALRAAFQVQEILTTGNLMFPLAEASFLRKVKAGVLSYKNDVGPLLEAMMDDLEVLTKQSTLPDSVDREYWDSFMVGVMLAEAKEAA